MTSLITLLTASCATCLAAVDLTEVLDPVSSSVRSLSNLMNGEPKSVNAAPFQITERSCRDWEAGPRTENTIVWVYLRGDLRTGVPTFKSPVMMCDMSV